MFAKLYKTPISSINTIAADLDARTETFITKVFEGLHNHGTDMIGDLELDDVRGIITSAFSVFLSEDDAKAKPAKKPVEKKEKKEKKEKSPEAEEEKEEATEKKKRAPRKTPEEKEAERVAKEAEKAAKAEAKAAEKAAKDSKPKKDSKKKDEVAAPTLATFSFSMNPVPLTAENSKFWQCKGIKIGADKHRYHEPSGLIITADDNHPVLIGRLVEGEILELDELSDNILDWVRKCGVIVPNPTFEVDDDDLLSDLEDDLN